MSDLVTRRGLIKAAGKGLVAVGGLVIASRMPTAAEAAGHSSQCGAQFGPLHRYLWATAPDPWWQDAVIWRESNWDPWATNPSSGAAGLAQFLSSTWAWGQEIFGIDGSPYDPYAAIRMMSAFIADGQYYHWSCGGQAGCYDV